MLEELIHALEASQLIHSLSKTLLATTSTKQGG